MPDPVAMTSGDGIPFASVMSVRTVFTTCTTTFVAWTCVPSLSVWGTVPWERSHAFFLTLHFQYTSEDPENGRCTVRATSAPPAGVPSR